ncbi:MAG: transglutaminase domain-containing protein [Niameybacter sp.]
MKKAYRFKFIGVLLLLVCSISITTGAKSFEDLGTVRAYVVESVGKQTLVSRDGSLAEPVLAKTMITLPGTYFLTQNTLSGEINMRCFTIPAIESTTEWHIQKPSQLKEVLKNALQTYQEEITLYFENSTYTLDQLNQMIRTELDALVMEYPKIYYNQYKLTVYGQRNPKVMLTFKYAVEDRKKLLQYSKQVDEQVKKLINTLISTDMKDYEREWKFVDYLVNNVSYGKGIKEVEHMMFGGLVDKVAVCDGYAKSLMYLLNSVGVPTKMVTGTARGIDENGGNIDQPHAWNLVKINGAYYHVDVTWADQDQNNIGNYYNYINEKDEYMALTHTWEKAKYPKTTSDQYLSINLPLKLAGVYKVDSKSEWTSLKRQLSQEKGLSKNIIFYNLSTHKWSLDKILQEIVKLENNEIYYSSYYKYDCLILNYKSAH